MAYTHTNYKTKKALKAAVANGEEVTVFQPGPFGPGVKDGTNVPLEGPHFPQPHTWYASATVVDGKVVKVR